MVFYLNYMRISKVRGECPINRTTSVKFLDTLLLNRLLTEFCLHTAVANPFAKDCDGNSYLNRKANMKAAVAQVAGLFCTTPTKILKQVEENGRNTYQPSIE